MNDQQRSAMREAISTLVQARARIVNRGGSGWKLEAQRCINAIASLNEVLGQPQDHSEQHLNMVQGSWVDLTDDEIREIHWSKPMDEYVYAREVIAKFKEKNTPKVVPQGEPVAWIHYELDYGGKRTNAMRLGGKEPPEDNNYESVPLYTAPPSVEATIEATKEKCIAIAIQHAEGTLEEEIEAIRSMK